MSDESVQTEKRKRGRPAKPATKIEDTAEFQEAVKKAAADMATEIAANVLREIEAKRGTSERVGGDETFAQSLGLAIAQLSHQGVGRAKPVDPALLKKREDARALMMRLMVEAHTSGQIPQYRLRNKIYLNEILIEPVWIEPGTKEQKPTIIDWKGVPNQAMLPENDVAKAIYDAYAESVGTTVIEKSNFIKPEVLNVTAGGLVVRSGGHALQPMRQQVGQPSVEGEGLRIHNRTPGQDKGKTINVLGTTAAPARVGI